MTRLMVYDVKENKWKEAKLSDVFNYRNAKVWIKDEWIAIKDLVEDDINGN